MTLNEALNLIKNPYELNRTDAAIEGYADAPVGTPTKGYRIYAVDEAGYRYSPVRRGQSNDVENDVYYWHNKRVAEAYMAYLGVAEPHLTYGLYEVEAVKGDRIHTELIYNSHTAHYGQFAQVLHVTHDAMIQVLTPEMIAMARENPDAELFSD